MHSDITPPIKNHPEITTKCGKCKLCKSINTNETITSGNININVNDGGTCKSKGVVYAARCKKHLKLYVGQTGERLSDRFSKHRYDIKNRPDNTELAAHFHENHSIDDDLDVIILQSNLLNQNERIHHEDRWICRLQTLQPNGINADGGNYVKEMYTIHTHAALQRNL